MLLSCSMLLDDRCGVTGRKTGRDYAGRMRGQVSIRWVQTTLCGTPLNRWSATIEAPIVIREFASLNLEGGIWHLRITRLRGYKPLHVLYRSERTAKKHLERWVQYHWQTVDGTLIEAADPRARAGRRSDVAAYLRARMSPAMREFDLYASHHH